MNKKLLLCLWLLSAACCSTQLFGQGVLGDVNWDNSINIIDALLVASYSVGQVGNPSSLSNFHLEAADVNGDKKANIIDALLIAQYYVGLIKSFPAYSYQLDEKYRVVLIPLIDKTVLGY